MMLFSSFFFLPLIFFVFYSDRPTAAAATLAASPIKRRGYNLIECEGLLPLSNLPYPNLLGMCARRAGSRGNLACECIGSVLFCGRSLKLGVQLLTNWCYNHCECGPKTQVMRNPRTTDLDHEPGWDFDDLSNRIVKKWSELRLPNPQTSHSGNHPTGNTQTCSGTCSRVDRGCNRASNVDCKCYAPPATSLFWHSGGCGLVHELRKRDLAQQRHSYYLNATAKFASSNKSTAPLGPLPDHAVQLASGLLPSPCNASYVSFACSDSLDGIVHEPPQNWLGALVPEGAKKLPPVPMEFLRIHGGKEGNMQVLRSAVD